MNTMEQIMNISQRIVHSKQLAEIAERRAEGTPMTHILNYKISKQPPNWQDASAIRRTLIYGIWDQRIREQIAAIPSTPNQLYPVPVRGGCQTQEKQARNIALRPVCCTAMKVATRTQMDWIRFWRSDTLRRYDVLLKNELSIVCNVKGANKSTSR